MILSSLALTAGPGNGLDYGDFVQLRIGAPLPVPGKITVVVQFELLPGAPPTTRGKVCWDPAAAAFDNCGGTTSLCPKRPPPPDTPPTPGTQHLLSFVSNTLSDLTDPGVPLNTRLFDLGPSRGVLHFASSADVLPGLNALFKFEATKPTSFHIVRIVDVLDGGAFVAGDLSDRILAIPVTGDTTVINP